MMQTPTWLIILALALLPTALHYAFRKEYPVPPKGCGVVITGASSGIGFDSAVDLAQQGFTVFAGVRSDKSAAKVRAVGNANLRPLKVDVTAEDSVSAAAAEVGAWSKEAKAPVCALVNNAGVSKELPVEVIPMAFAQQTYDVNVFGLMRATKAFLPLLKKQPGSRLVNIGSVAGLVARPGTSVYSGTKHAVEAMTDAYRRELDRYGMSVSVVEPAYVKTNIDVKSLGSNAPHVQANLTPEQMALYADHFAKADATREKTFKTADTTEVTNVAISHAITDPYPNTRYVVARVGNIPAWVVARLVWLLPDRVADVVINGNVVHD